MRDTTYVDPLTGKIPNDGDDIAKAHQAEENAIAAGGAATAPIYTSGVAYTGEGVSWYDLAQNAVGAQGGVDLLPAYVTSLTVDSQGRVVIGTEDGVWRAVYHGVGYDYSSGGGGVLPVVTPTPQVSITTINGNLQIAQLTSVALDPLVPGRIYTTEYGTGSAVTSGGLTWSTSGLTGPANVNGGPDGDSVVAALPDPTAPAGTLPTTYLLYAFNDTGASTEFQPLSSDQAGNFGTYVDVSTAGISLTDKAGYLPVLNIYDQKILDSGKYEDELLLGTDKIYTSRTSGALWDAISPVLSAGADVVVATFAQSTDQVIYAATSDGKLFVTQNDGADGWPEEDTGLPTGGTITSIQVDANSSQVAWVTVNGGPAGSGHVYMTLNGGASWRNITGNLPASAAYALAENPQSQPVSGAPSGRLYVGTNSGVYVTTNDATWTLLGVGLPNVAVTSLQFNQNLEELVAGTDGQGAFLISTDFVGAHVVSVSPAGPVNPLTAPLTSVTVTFNEAISSFPLSQVLSIVGPNGPIPLTKVGPGGQTIPTISVTDVSVALPGEANPQTQWQITFPPQTENGIYTFQIGPDILDIVGNPMDQNGDQINGENPGDIATFTVDLNSTDDGHFVTGLYNDLLGRPADTVGFETVLAPIDQARNSLLPGIASAYVSQLGAPQLITDLYQSSGVTDSTTNAMSIIGVGDLLGQSINSPNFAGSLTYWEGVLQNGGSIEQIIASLASSPQYFDQTGAGHDINGNDTAFVTQVYEDLLNRAPTNTELNGMPGVFVGFVPQLQSAEANARTSDARNNLLAGTAYQTFVITADYNLYLNRNPTTGATGEVAYWLNEFRAGVTQDQLVASLLGSSEYFTDDAPLVVGGGATASIDTWVRAVYKQLFPNYTISATEENYWDGLLNANQQTETQVAFILDTSSLYRFGNITPTTTNPGALSGSVDLAYQTLLGRDATPSEIAYWQGVYAANPNYRIEDLDAAILGSGEYFAHNSTANTPLGSQDQQWADAMYEAMFNEASLTLAQQQAVQNTDLPFLTIAEENARLAVSTAVVGSGEYHTDVTDFVYEKYLDRAPTAAEVALWQPIVGQGASVAGGLNGDEQLVNAVLSSPEYFDLQSDPSDSGLATNNSWLTSLYTSLRVPFQAGGEAANLAYLDNAYAPARLTAIEGFLTSPEYRTDFIQSEYNALLGRAASANEVAFWLGDFKAGVTQEQLIASLISSPEFFTRAPIILNQLSTPASNTTLVEAAYQVLFPGYTITASDLNTWVPRLNAGSITSLQMATILDTSALYYFGSPTNPPESPAGSPFTNAGVNGFINRQYLKFLGRNATQAEINTWMSVFTSTPNLIASLLDSTEYLNKTHQFP